MRSVWSSVAKASSHVDTLVNQGKCELLTQSEFFRTLARERKRAERSQRSFVLMLLKSIRFFRGPHSKQSFARIATALSVATRDTDVIGWYEAGSVMGVVFTEIGTHSRECIIDVLSKKMEAVLREAMGDQHFIRKHSARAALFPGEQPA